MSFNALARRPMVLGVPFMPALIIGCAGMLCTAVAGMFFGATGWLFGLVVVAVFYFLRWVSVTDDRAVEMMLIEAKWALIKMWCSQNGKYSGGTLVVRPIKYGRQL